MTWGDPNSTGIYATNNSLSQQIPTITLGDLALGPGQEPLIDRLERIERCLGITSRHLELEEKYPDLKQLGDQIEQAIDEMQKYQAEMISRVVGAYKDFVKECEIMEKLSKDGANP